MTDFSGEIEFDDLRLLTPDEVCALLRVKKSWLYDVVEAGTIEVVRLGKQLRFRRSALERYLTAQEVRLHRRSGVGGPIDDLGPWHCAADVIRGELKDSPGREPALPHPVGRVDPENRNERDMSPLPRERTLDSGWQLACSR